MTKETYTLLENYMLSCMTDSAHDKAHVYRVLYHALEIAKAERAVDYDVLIAACLLHDIGRKEQFDDPSLCHAIVGGEKAYTFLEKHGFTSAFAQRVRHCIQAHRFRKSMEPQTIEAKILFDADKLDVTGTVGIARTLLYQGALSRPLYSLLADGTVSDGTGDCAPSFFQEYKFKLEKLYDRFYTQKGTQLAQSRRTAAEAYYKSLYEEINAAYRQGTKVLGMLLDSSEKQDSSDRQPPSTVIE